MTSKKYYKAFLLLSLIIQSIYSYAQDKENTEDNAVSVNVNGVKGWHVGFYAGAFFANNYPASLYDGYGLDVNGNKNTFANSAMYEKIIIENSGINGNDNITPALGLTSRDQWDFNDESLMPTNLKYNTAFMFGLCLQYGLTRSEGLIANLNFAKINVGGIFEIEEHLQKINPLLSNNDSLVYFPVTGQEQRLMLQLGYQRVLGDPDNQFNFLVEGGLTLDNAKYLKNVATINNLTLDLTTYYNIYNNPTFQQIYSKFGYGVFGGFGINFNSTKYIVQLIYNPSYERIGLGPDPTAKLQNSVGLRVYYNL